VKPLGLVLDTSAVLLYPHLDVGETITQVEENGYAFTVPMPCLAAARDHDPVKLLLAHPAFQPTDLPFGQWRQYGAIVDMLGREDCAAAFLLAVIHETFLLTARPDWYGPLGDDPFIIAI
jgi:hypothetical protein